MFKTILLASGKGAEHIGVQFLGETNNLISYTNLSVHFSVMEGSQLNGNIWLSFIIDGKSIFVSKHPARYRISYDTLYSSGLVYGEDGYGTIPPPNVTPTHQHKTISIGGKTYKCRLLRGCDDDPSMAALDEQNGLGYDSLGTRNSEWSRIFHSIVIDDPNIEDYQGPKLAAYTIDDLRMHKEYYGSWSWCQDSFIGSPEKRLGRGYYGPSHGNWNISKNLNSDGYGWRPVLELID